MYAVKTPLIITSRLLPGLKVGDATISVEVVDWDGRGFATRYYIDGPDGLIYEGDDLSVACGAQDVPREALSSLLSFLGSDAEKYMGSGGMGSQEPTDGYSFDARTAEWAYLNDCEIAIAQCELDPSV